MRGATVDVELERRFHALHPSEWDEWWAWLSEVVGNPRDARILELTLGEGYLAGLVETGQVLDGEAEVIPVVWDAPVPPPCWPRGEWE